MPNFMEFKLIGIIVKRYIFQFLFLHTHAKWLQGFSIIVEVREIFSVPECRKR